MHYLGLDLGTKTLGVATSNGLIVTPLATINFKFEDYEYALNKVLEIIKEKNIDLVVLGLPKNMDGSLGFASERSLNFQKMLEDCHIKVELVDERLTTKMAENIIHDNLENVKNMKNKIDAVAASIILEGYLERLNNENKK